MPVWRGGLNKSLMTYGYMFVRKGENPHDISVLLNAASQMTKWQTQLTNDVMQQLLLLEQAAMQANTAVADLQQQVVQLEATLKGPQNGETAEG